MDGPATPASLHVAVHASVSAELTVAYVEGVLEGDRRARLALAAQAARGDALALEALFRAGVRLATERRDVGAAAAFYKVAAQGGHCAALHACGVAAEEAGKAAQAHELYLRAVAAGEAAAAAAPRSSSVLAAAALAVGHGYPPSVALASFLGAAEASRMEAVADATFRLGDLVDEGAGNGLAVDLPAARALHARGGAL